MTTNLSKEELATRYTNALKASEANKELNTNNYYTPKEIAKEYNIPVDTVNGWLYKGKINSYKKPNGRRLIKAEDVTAFRKSKIEFKEWRWN